MLAAHRAATASQKIARMQMLAQDGLSQQFVVHYMLGEIQDPRSDGFLPSNCVRSPILGIDWVLIDHSCKRCRRSHRNNTVSA